MLPQATLQQKPSTQFPPLHCAPIVQAWPTGVSVQLPAVVSHAFPFAQSLSVAHAVRQAVFVALHLKVPHDEVVPATQVAALHIPAVVCV